MGQAGIENPPPDKMPDMLALSSVGSKESVWWAMSDDWQGRWTRRRPSESRWFVYERASGELICELNKRPGGDKDFGDDCGDLIEHAPELHEGCLKALSLLRSLQISDGEIAARVAQVAEYLEFAIDCPPPMPGDFRHFTG